MKRNALRLCVVLACACIWAGGCAKNLQSCPCGSEWTNLLDEALSHWDVWLADPHSSIKELPEGYTRGKAIGSSDPYDVYATEKDANGDWVMKVTGMVYGGLTSKAVYENFHLTLEFKWGEKKWAPRLNEKRDSGILYHCTGEHGAMWKVWKKSVELQIMEEDFGDLFLLGGPTAMVTVEDDLVWNPSVEPRLREGQVARAIRSVDTESPHGEWTRIDLYVLGDSAVHMVNGTAVMALNEIKLDGEPLSAGQLQLQSEGAECYYRDVRIRSITALPEALAEAITK
ncbi:DUF1080 domain-containing protein [Planctomycetota bacterium]